MSLRVERAPAKINLGLEILGRRPDGYHEVRTILVAISLHDTLAFEPAHGSTDMIAMEPAEALVPDDANIVASALAAIRAGGAVIPSQRVTITKRIPAAAGLGGASSDAAATIRAFMPELDAADIDARSLAARLGSDVPFFLDGPAALASDRGEVLTPLPAPDRAWVVLAVPKFDIADKTRTMYGTVEPAWWSDGRQVQAIADRLPSLPSSAPFNVFERALLRLFPDLEHWREKLIEAGFPFVAVTGAGPAHFTLVASEDRARHVASTLGSSGVEAIVARLRPPGPEPGDA